MAKTLEELKAENAAAESTETVIETETVPTVEDEIIEDVDTEEADTDTDNLGEDEPEEVLEPWMQTESESETVPVSVLAKTRSKLKAKVGERDEEIERLKGELKQYQNPNQAQQVAQVPPRPTREQFDYDDDAYDAAVDEWQMKRFNAQQQSQQQQSQVSKQHQDLMSKVSQEADAHYQRAEKLVASGAVSADSYTQADSAVRSAFEQLYPNNGDAVTDAMIMQLNSVGEGSEKVMYFLGKNPSALATLKSKLQSDPSNLQAMMYLGTLQAKVTHSPTKKVSQAPKPGTQLKGEETTSAAAKPQLKKYQAAHKANNSQLAFSIKREARQKGIDTSNW